MIASVASTAPTPSGGTGANSGPPLISEPAAKTRGNPIAMNTTQYGLHRHRHKRDRNLFNPATPPYTSTKRMALIPGDQVAKKNAG